MGSKEWGHSKNALNVEPVFGIIKAVLGFTGFSQRGLDKVAGEWEPVVLAYNRKRLHKLEMTS